jgi:VWFA-related protein
MLDAVTAAIEHLRGRNNARRVLLLISESRDRGSETALEDAVLAAQSAGVTVYALTYSALATGFTSRIPPVIQLRRTPNPNTPSAQMGTLNGAPPNQWNPKIPPPEHRADVLAAIGEAVRRYKGNTVEALTTTTGGSTFSFTRQKALEDAVMKLGTELHSQYLLSFVPEPQVPGYHSLEVRLTRPGDFSFRQRPGYWLAEEAK